MRRGTNDVAVLRNEEGGFIGVSLGWDFCAEHEWGVNKLTKAFGIPNELTPKNAGIAYRTATKVPEGLRVFDFDGAHFLIYRADWWDESVQTPQKLNHILESYSSVGTAGAWSDSAFGLRVMDDDKDVIPFLLDAANNNRLAIYLAGQSDSFGNSGLLLFDVNRLPEDGLKQMREVDLSTILIQKAVKDTGIEKRLKEANCRYYALSPKFAEDGSLLFWLNPMYQENNNYGWYTILDLEDWINGTGKIPKSVQC